MPRSAHHRTLCANHAHRQEDRRSETQSHKQVARELASLSGHFTTASDVNHVLGKLFSLVAQGRIPRRDAVALAYIAQLLLQSLPAVQKEVKQALGYDAWQQAVEAALAPSTEQDEAAEEDESTEPDEAHNDHDLDEGDNRNDPDEADQAEITEAENEAEIAEADSEAELDEAENKDEPDEAENNDQPIEKLAAAGFAEILLAAARDEIHDQAERAKTRSRANRAPTEQAPPHTPPDRPKVNEPSRDQTLDAPPATSASELTFKENAGLQHRVPPPRPCILRTPGLFPGTEQVMEVTLGDGWGLNWPPPATLNRSS
jgi:hypothetical protein